MISRAEWGEGRKRLGGNGGGGSGSAAAAAQRRPACASQVITPFEDGGLLGKGLAQVEFSGRNRGQNGVFQHFPFPAGSASAILGTVARPPPASRPSPLSAFCRSASEN